MTAWADTFNSGSYPSGWADQLESNGTMTPSAGGLLAVTTNSIGMALAARAISTSADISTLDVTLTVNSATTSGGQGYIIGLLSSGWVSENDQYPVAWIDYVHGTGWRVALYDSVNFGAVIADTLDSGPTEDVECTLTLEVDRSADPIVVNAYLDGVLVGTATDTTGTGANGVANTPTKAVLGARQIAGDWGPWDIAYADAEFSEAGFDPPDTTAPVISGVATSYTFPTGWVTGMAVNEPVTNGVDYGLDGQALSEESTIFDDLHLTADAGRSIPVGGLQPNTAYDYTPFAVDAALNESTYSTVHSVTTDALRDLLVIVPGDSIPAGQGIDPGDRWSAALATELGTDAHVRNVAIGGTSNTQWRPTSPDRFLSRLVTPFIPGGASSKKIVIYEPSGNGTNIAGEYTAWAASIAALQSAGVDYIIATTVPPRTAGGGAGGDFDQINDPIRANWEDLGIFRLIDWINDEPDLADPADTDFYSDGTHWTAAGHDAAYPHILAAVQDAIADVPVAGASVHQRAASTLLLGV